jgi:two-component system, NtrC family, response regulator
MSPMVLVVDDDRSVTTSLALLLKQSGFAAVTAADPAAALAKLDENAIDLVVQDMNFARSTTGEEGLRLLREIRVRHPGVPVILITAWGSIALAVEGIKAGATDFVTKPWNNTSLVQTVRTALSLAAHRSVHADRESLDRAGDFREIVGEHPALLRVLSHVIRVAKTDATVLITGESGTGKELLADAIHRNSQRAHGPLVKVNMGAIVPSLFESEMFGHVRGAFTDAKDDRIGYLEQAGGGTLFLDEVAELDSASQVKLLRVLQDREFRRVGSSQSKRADIRVVAATNRDLSKLIAERTFREDLYYRLNLISLELPPVRARKADISLIVADFLVKLRERYRLECLECSEEAYRWLEAQRWPGNVRQLTHCLERAVLLSGDSVLKPEDFQAVSDSDEGLAGRAPQGARHQLALDEVERNTIQEAMDQAGGNVTRAAELLRLSRAALYRRLTKYGLVRE